MKKIFSVIILIILYSCAKTPNDKQEPPTPPVDTSKVVIPKDSFTVDNMWECQIDGVPYQGTIDTSFIHINSSYADTIIDCNGTSINADANIHFQIRVNKAQTRDLINTGIGNAMLVFDTITPNFLIAAQAYYTSGINYIVDNMNADKISARFSGSLSLQNAVNGSSNHTVTNGKFSCRFGKGNHRPNNFSFTDNSTLITGYFNSAKITSNCLILEGQPYTFDGTQKFTLLIRTGGTIKPGTYYSTDGDAGLRFYTPSIYRYYINDTMGTLKVSISKVDGNKVEGTYDGVSFDGKVISGTFASAVKNYIPQIDYADKWKFTEDEQPFFLYNIYGGNVTSANRSQVGSNYFLTVNGESDNGDSQLKLILKSPSPIVAGTIYESKVSENSIDSFYFKSNTRIWNGNTTYLFSNDYYDTYCRVDSIDNYHVLGTIYGKINISTQGPVSNTATSTNIKEGNFRASF
ncbi:MAG: hypothetical protein ABI091_05075 [Ferruginibacter sp.]